MRSVAVLSVAEARVWDELCTHIDLDPYVERVLDDTRRVVGPAFAGEGLTKLREAGAEVLERFARRDPVEQATSRDAVVAQVAALPSDVAKVLHVAQRHALDEVVLGAQAWDPRHDAARVRHLLGAGLLQTLDAEEPLSGRLHLHPDLPPPPGVPLDLDEAVMDETDDLEEARPGPVGLLHDLASLAAVVERIGPRRTHSGMVSKTDARKLGRALGSADLVDSGQVEADPRWGRALRGLELLGAVAMDPVTRQLHLDHDLERTLAGTTEQATDRLVHRLLDRDLHVVLPAVRAALHQAGTGAVDEMVFLELLRDQHRQVLFVPWDRKHQRVYPVLGHGELRLYDDAGWDKVERRIVRAVLGKLSTLGLIRRATGVFAGTHDGRRWAGVEGGPMPPIWVSSDLEVVVPPDAITPWERFQLERLGTCVGRDVVDRYRLGRRGLAAWLRTHELDEALALLERRCPGVPVTVRETLTQWARSVTRVVLTRGVLLSE